MQCNDYVYAVQWLCLCSTMTMSMQCNDYVYAVQWLCLCSAMSMSMECNDNVYAVQWLRLCTAIMSIYGNNKSNTNLVNFRFLVRVIISESLLSTSSLLSDEEPNELDDELRLLRPLPFSPRPSVSRGCNLRPFLPLFLKGIQETWFLSWRVEQWSNRIHKPLLNANYMIQWLNCWAIFLKTKWWTRQKILATEEQCQVQTVFGHNSF